MQQRHVTAYEDFVMLVGIAYNLLFLSQDLVQLKPIKKWYQNAKSIAKTPSNVFHAFARGDFFKYFNIDDVKQRGIPNQKNIRKTFKKKVNQAILRKCSNSNIVKISINRDSEKCTKSLKLHKNIDPKDLMIQLTHLVKQQPSVLSP